MKLLRVAALISLLAIALDAQSNLDEIAARTLKEFNVPGVAVGVIQDGHVLVAKGYGVRKIGESAPVTEHSLFQIASNSKAFTSASLAILVDQKKISWDDRVIDVLPSFQMSDPYVSREMRIRDLLCHRSGLSLGAGDLMLWPDASLSTAEFMRHLRFVPLATSFRSHYAYDNVLYTVAGQIIEKVSGMSWQDFIQQKVFDPLGMTESRPRAEELKPADETAMPHALNGEKLEVLALDHLGPGAPAGAILSSIHDMLSWANVQLHEGEYAGGRLFSAEQSKQMWTPHIFMPVPDKYPPQLASQRPNFQAYGLGWVLTEYQGERIVFHTGGLGGMVTRVTLVPDKKLAILVFTNQEQGGAFNAITYSLLDQYLGHPTKDWVAAYGAVSKRHQSEGNDTVAKAEAARNKSSQPSLPLDKYAGRYRDAWYGDVLVNNNGGKLGMQFSHSPRLTGALEHFQYDTFIVHWNDRTMNADAYVTFDLNPDASIHEVKMKPVSPLTDFSFDFQDLDLKPVTSSAKPW